ncbi:hypothetical protein DACRYDRAFT_54959 [Dacryopinax primogenitus]|uniref:Uncharacterized protein n=1 Tax=Dacryopinax primogenitus (strain DJM 731) TaxID=1858805 RepID=M5FVY1_DACPD|nr:uncharacterized protein DACRYDRAFT_54959 [Dacryopinax primogenitus]EJT99784.1 hypothetical protein DACRYDRAFT_54959 [Dacryopinax primogenitus]
MPATFGGIPTMTVDVPVCSVLIACYASLAATHLTIYIRNRRRKRYFRPSVLLFAFCMARIVTLSLRIAWACHPTNPKLALASGIFLAAGVLLVWIINRIFATRALSEYHPWVYRQPFKFFITQLPYIIVLCFLPMMITVVVLQSQNPSPSTMRADNIILKVALAYFVAFTFSPFVVFFWIYIVPPHRTKEEVYELQRRFGTGKTTKKMAVIALATALLVTELCFRVATSLQTFPVTDAPGYYGKPTFYIVIYGFEILVLTLYAAARVDKLFYSYGPHETLPEENETMAEMS